MLILIVFSLIGLCLFFGWKSESMKFKPDGTLKAAKRYAIAAGVCFLSALGLFFYWLSQTGGT